MRTAILALVLAALLTAGACWADTRRPVSFELDAPKGMGQWSRTLGWLRAGSTFNLYLVPLKQHLGDSTYATEIQVHYGGVCLAFARLEPAVINRHIDDPDRLPPIWEIRQVGKGRAVPVDDSRIVALGRAAVSLQDRVPSLSQARHEGRRLRLYHRPAGARQPVLVGSFAVEEGSLPVRTRVIGYRARFVLP